MPNNHITNIFQIYNLILALILHIKFEDKFLFHITIQINYYQIVVFNETFHDPHI